MKKGEQKSVESPISIPQFSVLFVHAEVHSEESLESVSRSLHYMDYSQGTLQISKRQMILNPCSQRSVTESPLSSCEADVAVDDCELEQSSGNASIQQFVQEVLNRPERSFDAVHLDLETTDDHCAFVLSWKSSLWTILNNSKSLFSTHSVFTVAYFQALRQEN